MRAAASAADTGTLGRDSKEHMDSFELQGVEQAIEELIQDTPAPGKHCARNAIRHIKKAWSLADVDREMAVFRAITAEEESATAIFHSLRRRRYTGSNKLRPRDHIHKNAVTPFIAAVYRVLSSPIKEFEMNPILFLNKEEEPKRFRIQFNVSKIIGKEGYATPQPPLHFSITKENGQPIDFSPQLAELADMRNVNSIHTHIQERANLRNKILYASTGGAPEVSSLNAFLPAQRAYIFTNLYIYLLIDPYPEKQLFVQQTLQAFLRMFELLPGDITYE